MSNDNDRNEAADWLAGRGANLMAVMAVLVVLAILWSVLSGAL